MASLRDYASKKGPKNNWLRQHCGFLYNPMSVFYFGVFVILLSMAWMLYALVDNEFTQLLNWDYTWQFVPFAYDYYDSWRAFYATGKFPLYDGGVFMGTDNIGSGSYYGLFDPFVVVMTFFPRNWIPNLYAVTTFLRFAVSALLMRAYLKSLGCQEWTARLGAVAYAFSGFATFMSGFPNVLTATVYIPMILWGIERVLKERKPGVLIWAVFLEGVTSFFYLVVACIFGVFYALWRFFTQLKTRTKNENIQAMLLGVGAFAVGLMLCAFTWVPSVRESALSGRASSIGSAYLHSILDSLKSHDFASFFSLIFEEVGDNPGRELMGVVSFFFPTGGFTRLPLENSGYDAWTASLFCYTPIVISFFMAIFQSLMRRRFDHIVAVLLCTFMVLTNLSYFLFYAFSGNGYGRWYIVLVPIIIAYGCWGFDLRNEGPRVLPLCASVLTLALTILTYHVTISTLDGVTFSSGIYNIHETTYWQSTYHTANQVYDGLYAAWFLYYQIALIVIESIILVMGYRKEWMPKILFGCLCVEVFVMGNLTYAFNGLWSYSRSFGGGSTVVNTSTALVQRIKEQDNSFFRVHNDMEHGSSYLFNLAGYNAAISFHSLMNFEVEDFAFNNQMKNAGSTNITYGDTKVYNPNWSGAYRHRRFAMDTILNYRYYIVENAYSGFKDADGNPVFLEPNVPFGAVELSTSFDRNKFRLYKMENTVLPELGYAVKDDSLYYLGHDETKESYLSSFYSNPSFSQAYREMQRAQEVELTGAMIEDNVVLDGFEIKKDVPTVGSDDELYLNYGVYRYYNGHGIKASKYVTGIYSGDLMLPDSNAEYLDEGAAYFLNHHLSKEDLAGTSTLTLERDTGKLVFHNDGAYLNSDKNGAYIEYHYYSDSKDAAPRVYAIGDKFDEHGVLVAENVVLGFDNSTVSSAMSSSYWSNKMSTYGLYARGRVKYLVFCLPGDGTMNLSLSNIYFSVKEKHDIEATYKYLNANKLLNIQNDVNAFAFDTDFKKDRIVVTTLGFDKGWQGTVTAPDGSKSNLQMLKLDGGLVGFVAKGAPDSVYHYELRYVTPYSSLGVAAWVVGSLAFGSYLGLSLLWDIRKKKIAQASQG